MNHSNVIRRWYTDRVRCCTLAVENVWFQEGPMTTTYFTCYLLTTSILWNTLDYCPLWFQTLETLCATWNNSTVVCPHFQPLITEISSDDIGEREIDFFQNRDLDLILTERATRFYDPKLSGIEKEKCILVAVDTKLETRRAHVESAPIFSLKESLRYLWRRTRNVIHITITYMIWISHYPSIVVFLFPPIPTPLPTVIRANLLPLFYPLPQDCSLVIYLILVECENLMLMKKFAFFLFCSLLSAIRFD